MNSHEGLHLGDEFPKHLALKINRAHYPQDPSALTNTANSSQRLTCGLTFHRSLSRGGQWRGAQTSYERGLFTHFKILTWGAGM